MPRRRWCYDWPRPAVTVDVALFTVAGAHSALRLEALLIQRDATVTVCNSKTPDLASFTRSADVVVVAVGRAGLLRSDMVKAGAAVVDVGVNRLADGTLAGDVDAAVAQRAGYLTPVPGGVGPMTVAMLIENTVKAAERIAPGAT